MPVRNFAVAMPERRGVGFHFVRDRGHWSPATDGGGPYCRHSATAHSNAQNKPQQQLKQHKRMEKGDSHAPQGFRRAC
jgi:hypothetical protein